ncbi:MAG: hypothetical protein DRR08_27215 [Candidatus Parabeggiatoa sp. nov. 2]|nr:MAG: hypothetical protein DRR08_27215 [Gammaproteobacteria bacterium]
MPELPTQLQLVAKILDDGIKLFIRSFPKVLPLALADALLSALLHLLIPELNSPQPAVLIAAVMDSLIYLFLYVVLMLLLQAAIFYRLSAILTQSDMGNVDALLQAVKKWLPILLATWLYTFLCGVGLLVIIPGIILAVSLRFFIPLILFDNATVLESLQRSHQLVWGNWWHTAIVLTIPLLIIISVGVMSSAIVEGILTLSTGFAKEQINLLIQITYGTVDKLLSPLFYAIILIQYYDLKRRNKQQGYVEKHFIA